MGPKAAAMVAAVIDRLEGRPPGTGRPPVPTLKVVEALRLFAREGVPAREPPWRLPSCGPDARLCRAWRELRATAGRASGATLRRRLGEWAGTALLRRVHLALIRMVRAGPEPILWDVVVDSCSVRAKHEGQPLVRGGGALPLPCRPPLVLPVGAARWLERGAHALWPLGQERCVGEEFPASGG